MPEKITYCISSVGYGSKTEKMPALCFKSVFKELVVFSMFI